MIWVGSWSSRRWGWLSSAPRQQQERLSASSSKNKSSSTTTDEVEEEEERSILSDRDHNEDAHDDETRSKDEDYKYEDEPDDTNHDNGDEKSKIGHGRKRRNWTKQIRTEPQSLQEKWNVLEESLNKRQRILQRIIKRSISNTKPQQQQYHDSTNNSIHDITTTRSNTSTMMSRNRFVQYYMYRREQHVQQIKRTKLLVLHGSSPRIMLPDDDQSKNSHGRSNQSRNGTGKTVEQQQKQLQQQDEQEEDYCLWYDARSHEQEDYDFDQQSSNNSNNINEGKNQSKHLVRMNIHSQQQQQNLQEQRPQQQKRFLNDNNNSNNHSSSTNPTLFFHATTTSTSSSSTIPTTTTTSSMFTRLIDMCLDTILLELFTTWPSVVSLFVHCIAHAALYDIIQQSIEYLIKFMSSWLTLLSSTTNNMRSHHAAAGTATTTNIIPFIADAGSIILDFIQNHTECFTYLFVFVLGITLLRLSGYLYWWLSDTDYDMVKFDLHNRFHLHYPGARMLQWVRRRPIVQASLFYVGYYLSYCFSSWFYNIMFGILFSERESVIQSLPSRVLTATSSSSSLSSSSSTISFYYNSSSNQSITSLEQCLEQMGHYQHHQQPTYDQCYLEQYFKWLQDDMMYMSNVTASFSYQVYLNEMLTRVLTALTSAATRRTTATTTMVSSNDRGQDITMMNYTMMMMDDDDETYYPLHTPHGLVYGSILTLCLCIVLLEVYGFRCFRRY